MALDALTQSSLQPESHEADKDLPLRDDIRLLGRILGDTVREQEGEEVFELVEQIRRASIRFHRDNEVGARRELEATLDSLERRPDARDRPRLQLFLASGQHRRGSAPHPPQPRARDRRLSRRAPARSLTPFSARTEMGVEPKALGDFFDRALVSPVLTAHPTEVRRKSTLTRELEIADLLDERERAAGDEAELARNEEQLRRAVLILWRTNMLRQTRLTVIDEVANGLSYYDYTFFRELPRLYAAIEDELAKLDPRRPEKPIPSFLRVGSWIGGDRDGNPYVTASVLNEAMRLQSARALNHYLEELHELGGEFSLAGSLVRVSDELNALADRASDPSPNRRDEPYRRAITGMYSRLAKTARELDHVVALRHPLTDAPAYASVEELAADLDVVAQSLEAHGGAILARGRLRALRRAVDVFGFSLAPIDLRQNSDVHERTVAELLAAAAPGLDYRRMSEDGARRTLAAGNCARLVRWSRPSSPTARRRRGELGVFSAAAAIRRQIRRRRDPHRIISKTDSVSDMLELALLMKEVGLIAPAGRPRSISCRCSRRSRTCAPASA